MFHFRHNGCLEEEGWRPKCRYFWCCGRNQVLFFVFPYFSCPIASISEVVDRIMLLFLYFPFFLSYSMHFWCCGRDHVPFFLCFPFFLFCISSGGAPPPLGILDGCEGDSPQVFCTLPELFLRNFLLNSQIGQLLLFECADISDRCGGDSPPLRTCHRHHHFLHSEEEEEAEVEYQPLWNTGEPFF